MEMLGMQIAANSIIDNSTVGYNTHICFCGLAITFFVLEKKKVIIIFAYENIAIVDYSLCFKVRCSRYLYTLCIFDADKANKLKQSLLPPLLLCLYAWFLTKCIR
jgi:hypothetical protein